MAEKEDDALGMDVRLEDGAIVIDLTSEAEEVEPTAVVAAEEECEHCWHEPHPGERCSLSGCACDIPLYQAARAVDDGCCPQGHKVVDALGCWGLGCQFNAHPNAPEIEAAFEATTPRPDPEGEPCDWCGHGAHQGCRFCAERIQGECRCCGYGHLSQDPGGCRVEGCDGRSEKSKKENLVSDPNSWKPATHTPDCKCVLCRAGDYLDKKVKGVEVPGSNNVCVAGHPIWDKWGCKTPGCAGNTFRAGSTQTESHGGSHAKSYEDWKNSSYGGVTGGYSYSPAYKSCSHTGQPVKVGAYEILAGGTRDLRGHHLGEIDVLIPLTNDHPGFIFGHQYKIIAMPLTDFGGVPEDWKERVETLVIPELKAGKRVLCYCIGSHGRTGTLLATLIALLETPEETPDPIKAARERHCHKAVETKAQAEAVYALRDQKLPRRYRKEFANGRSHGSLPLHSKTGSSAHTYTPSQNLAQQTHTHVHSQNPVTALVPTTQAAAPQNGYVYDQQTNKESGE